MGLSEATETDTVVFMNRACCVEGQLDFLYLTGLCYDCSFCYKTLFTPLNWTTPAPLWTECPELCGFMSVHFKHDQLFLSPVQGHSCPVKPVQRHVQVTEYKTDSEGSTRSEHADRMQRRSAVFRSAPSLLVAKPQTLTALTGLSHGQKNIWTTSHGR